MAASDDRTVAAGGQATGRWTRHLSTTDKVFALVGLAQFVGCVAWMVLR